MAGRISPARYKPNPFYRRASASFRAQASLQRSWSGIVFRSVLLDFATPEQIVDGVGAMKAGGRWNRPRMAPVLYCSLNPGTAAEESMRLFEAAGFARKTVKPRLLVGIRYDLSAVVDLQEFLLSGKRLNLPQLLSEDWQRINNQHLESVGQAIGRAAFTAGIEGLLVPSSRVPTAVNLVVFPKNLRKTSLQEVLEAAELKKWRKP